MLSRLDFLHIYLKRVCYLFLTLKYRGQNEVLGQLYLEHNYFDQQQFIKDIKKHTGNNPAELLENKNDRFLKLATMKEKFCLKTKLKKAK